VAIEPDGRTTSHSSARSGNTITRSIFRCTKQMLYDMAQGFIAVHRCRLSSARRNKY